MSNILFYVLALLILALLIVVHEFGHYITGRLLGFKVLEFAVGFGPKLIKWERKGIKYSVRAIPLGGFCSFAGGAPPRRALRARAGCFENSS